MGQEEPAPPFFRGQLPTKKLEAPLIRKGLGIKFPVPPQLSWRIFREIALGNLGHFGPSLPFGPFQSQIPDLGNNPRFSPPSLGYFRALGEVPAFPGNPGILPRRTNRNSVPPRLNKANPPLSPWTPCLLRKSNYGSFFPGGHSGTGMNHSLRTSSPSVGQCLPSAQEPSLACLLPETQKMDSALANTAGKVWEWCIDSTRTQLLIYPHHGTTRQNPRSCRF